MSSTMIEAPVSLRVPATPARRSLSSGVALEAFTFWHAVAEKDGGDAEGIQPLADFRAFEIHRGSRRGQTRTAAPLAVFTGGWKTEMVGFVTLPRRMRRFPAISASVGFVVSLSGGRPAFSPGALLTRAEVDWFNGGARRNRNNDKRREVWRSGGQFICEKSKARCSSQANAGMVLKVATSPKGSGRVHDSRPRYFHSPTRRRLCRVPRCAFASAPLTHVLDNWEHAASPVERKEALRSKTEALLF